MVAKVLIAAAWSVLASCYAPAVRDCAIGCATTSDCAGGQTCTADGLCASATGARCPSLGDAPVAVDVSPIAADAARDAHVVMVDAPADAHGSVDLVIAITGMGEVALSNGPTCSSNGAQHGNCTFAVPYAMPQTLQANATHGGHFIAWTTLACAGQPKTCAIVPLATTVIGVTFGQ